MARTVGALLDLDDRPSRRAARRARRRAAALPARGLPAGWRCSGTTGSAGSWPTTWAWARRCRRWRWSARATSAATLRRPRRSWWWRRPAWWRPGRARRRGSPRPARARGRPRPAARRGRRWREAIAGADLVVTSYTLFRLDEDDVRGRGLGRPGPRRGAVRQEPPGQDLPGAPAARRAVQAGAHRHAAGEQPDGAVVAAVDRGARAFPSPQRFTECYRPSRSRTGGDPSVLGRAPPPDPAAHAAPHQGAGRRRPAAQAGAGARGRAEPAAPHDLRDAPAARAAEGARAGRRLRQQPDRDLPVADPAAPAQPRRRRWSTRRTPACGSAKVDVLVDQLAELVAEGHRALVFSQFTWFLSRVRDRLDAEGIAYVLPRRRAPATAPSVDRRRSRDGDGAGVPDQPQGRRLRAEPDRGRLRASCSTRGGTRPSRRRPSTAPTGSARPGR